MKFTLLLHPSFGEHSVTLKHHCEQRRGKLCFARKHLQSSTQKWPIFDPRPKRSACLRNIHQEKSQRCTSSILVAEVWKPPEIPQTNDVSGYSQDELNLAVPLLSALRFGGLSRTTAMDVGGYLDL